MFMNINDKNDDAYQYFLLSKHAKSVNIKNIFIIERNSTSLSSNHSLDLV